MHWSEASSEADGRLRIAVVGDGDEVALTTDALRLTLRQMGIASEVTPFDCENEEFRACVEHLSSLGFAGVSVCNPYKAEAAKLATEFFIVKRAMGVANALKLGSFISAQNTEVEAFNSKIRDIKPGLALVMGSGRAARSAVMSLFECGWRIKVWNRNVIRSRPFAIAFETYGKVELASSADPAGCSLIVNATPLGTKAGEQPPVKWQAASPRTTAIDFVYRKVATEFLRSAASRGFKAVDGRELLVEQAAIALEWWTEQPVPRGPMLEAVGLRGRG
jgi:shikimate dehydrogenase